MLNPKNRELHKMEATRKQQASLMSRNANLKVIKTKKALKDVPSFDDDEAVAERIKVSVETMEERLGVGNDLSYPEIAEVCEVSQKVVYGWAKNGKISKAKIPTLCAVLGVSVEYLLTGNEADKGGFTQTDGNRLSREVTSIGGRIQEHVVPVPIREPVELIHKMQDGEGQPLNDLMREWLTDATDSRSLAVSCLDPDHIRVPTWALQVVTSSFQPDLTVNTFALMSHNILPMEDDFACYLYKSDGVFQIAMGYVTYVNHDFSQPTFPVGRIMEDGNAETFADYAYRTEIRLKRNMRKPASTDVVLKGGHGNQLGRRFLGTMVAAQRWCHSESQRVQTGLQTRSRIWDQILKEEWDSQGVIEDQTNL